MKIKKALKAQGGFTLIEMLIVVAIIAILVAVSIPMVNNNLEKARKSTDQANVRAAKAAVTLKYMNEEIAFSGESTDVWYNAPKGEISATQTSEKYGKSKAEIEGVSGTPESKDLKITVKKDGTIQTMAWE